MVGMCLIDMVNMDIHYKQMCCGNVLYDASGKIVIPIISNSI